MARKPPHRRSSQPRVTGRTQQPTTGRGKIVHPRFRGVAPTTARPPVQARPAPVQATTVPVSQTPVQPQYSLANLPPDASYEQAVAQLQQQRAQNIAALAGERVRGLSDYGFQEGPNGTLTFDVNNPLSKASLLKQAYDTNRRSTGNQLASGGQLYAGARQNALDLVSRNQLQAQDSQMKALQAFLASNTGRRKQALSDYELAVGQAQGDRLDRFQSNPLYDPLTQAQIAESNANAALARAQMPGAPAPTQTPSGFQPLQTTRVPRGTIFTRPRTPSKPKRPSVRRPRVR